MKRTLCCLLLVFGAAPAPADRATLVNLAARFVQSGSPADREAVLRLATEHRASPEGHLARLVLGLKDYQSGNLAAAAEQLSLAVSAPGDFTDYAVYHQALALAGQNDHAGAAARLADFQVRFPASSWRDLALRRRVESLSLSGQAARALELFSDAPRTASDWLLLAQIAERAQDPVRAARTYQRVYYEHPASSEQKLAQAALTGLRTKLGPRYPLATPAMRLGRADRLASARQYSAARTEYHALSGSLSGLAREQALVRVGAADYHLRRNLLAYRSLQTLKVTQAEAAAERLYYLAAVTRRLNRLEEFTQTVQEMGRLHRTSRWYEEALFSAGNQFLLDHQPERYLQYYRQVYELFPQGRYAENAHWKVTWHAYQNRETAEQSEQAWKLLDEHARRYPSSPHATAALYWLGRLAESRSDWMAAGTLYTHLASTYPLYYHTLLAEERLRSLPAQAGRASPEVMQRLPLIRPSAAPPAKEPPAEVRQHLSRASLLAELGFSSLAERELRFRAESDGLAPYAGVELAGLAASRGNHFQAIRFLKRYTPGYLAYTVEAMPSSYWEMLFPLPWRDLIERYSKSHALDPFLVAGLIRQESEFNPGAVSSARARGLMQIMLPTGRRLARTAGLPPVTVQQLYRPETSLRLGTLHLKKVIDQYNGRLELALAGYNAGEHRVDRWLGLYPSEDPAEFVENIPFTETRNYVQSVLRNAYIYRKIYGG
jgi:soluble lytic murein transglycosylase